MHHRVHLKAVDVAEELTVTEFAHVVGASRKAVYRWIKGGALSEANGTLVMKQGRPRIRISRYMQLYRASSSAKRRKR